MDNQNDDDFDEVSLPGVGDNEQPTILEVLNKGIVNTEDGTEPKKLERNTGDTVNTIKVTSTLEENLKTPKNDKESDILVSRSSSSKSEAEYNEPQRSQLNKDEENVLDFESHLIETLNNYSVSEDSEAWGVDIKELPPAEGESLNRTSKIETDPLIGTVFEVEPATPKVLKPIETIVREPQRQSGLAQKTQIEQTSPAHQFEEATKKPVYVAEESNEGTKPFETTVENPLNELAQKADKIKHVVDPQVQIVAESATLNEELGADDTKTDVNDKRNPAAATQIETSVSHPKAESKDSVDPKFKSSNLSTEKESEKEINLNVELNKAQIDLAAVDPKVEEAQSIDPVDYIKEAEVESLITHSNEDKKPDDTIVTEFNVDVAHESETNTKKDLAAHDYRDNLVHSVDILVPTKEVEPGELTTKSNEDSKPTVLSDSGGEIHSKAEHKDESKVKGDITLFSDSTKLSDESLAQPQNDIHDSKAKSNDNAQAIDVAKTQTEPVASDHRIKVQTTTEKVSTEATIEKPKADTKTDLLPKELKHTTTEEEDTATLTQEIDQKLSELATHLTSSSKVDLNGNISKQLDDLESEDVALDINGLPLPKTALEEEQRQQFLDSLPQIALETDSNKVAALAKREYYQSLRQYLITHSDRPPIPPETYRWEDLKRAKQRGGYPWTHLYKRPLGPDEEPEIVLLLRKSQELRFSSESPKSFKKVRIDDQVSIKETERYIQELSDIEDNPTTEDEEEHHEDDRSECISCVSDSVLTVEKRVSKLGKIRGILKKRGPKKELDARSLPDTSTRTAASSSLTLNHKSEEDIEERLSRPLKEPQNKAKCFPIMKKLKSMADRQKKNFRNIKKISLKKDEKILLEEEQKIIKLKTSPKAERSEIPHFIEKQDSDDVLEIVELDESPSRKRKDQLDLQEQAAAAESTVVIPDEIIEIPKIAEDNSSDRQQTPEPTVSEILEEELKSNSVFSAPPKKTARLRREHVYEDIESGNGELVSEEINNILELASVEALKQSLSKQDSSALNDVEATKTATPLERMGSSEDDIERSHLAPISSIDSASSEDERKPHLSAVVEESDVASTDDVTSDKEDTKKLESVREVVKEPVHIPWNDIELKPALKKEASPSPSDKKVTFSHVEDEAEPHREDIELPEGLSGIGPKRWSNLR